MMARSMGFSGDKARAKGRPRALLALALAVLLLRGGERWAWRATMPPRAGRAQMAAGHGAGRRRGRRITAPRWLRAWWPWARGVPVGFPGRSVAGSRRRWPGADRGVRGALVQVLDPAEEDFPFDGRTIFESMGGTLRHETLRAGDLRARYLDRLAERKDRLATLARASGWHYLCHASHRGFGARGASVALSRAGTGALMWIVGPLGFTAPWLLLGCCAADPVADAARRAARADPPPVSRRGAAAGPEG
jgi:hypothetical protein